MLTKYRFWISLLPLIFPLYLVRFDLAGVPTTLLEVVVLVLAAWGAFRFVREKNLFKWFKRHVKVGQKSPLWPMILFLVAATISMNIVPEITNNIDGVSIQSERIAQGVWKGWIVVPAMFFFMANAVRGKDKWWTRSFKALVVSGFVLSLWAVYQMVSGDFITVDARASGPFESANYLSLYLAPIVLAGGALSVNFLRGKNKPWFWAMLVMTLVMGVALWGTQSYASFIALGVGSATYLLFHPAVPRQHKLWGFGFAATLVAVLLVTQQGTQKFEQFLDFEGRTSSSVRMEVYEVSLSLVKQAPVLGVGLGQFEVRYMLAAPEVLERAPLEWVMLHPHNSVLAFWLNTGLLGLFAMTWMVTLAFIKILHREAPHLPPFLQRFWNRFNHGPSTQLQLIGLAMLVVILTHGCFDTPFFKNDLAYLWWWVLAMLV
jgi:O-antigen ligase